MDNFDSIDKYRIQYKPEGIIVDTNILLLYLIGTYNRLLINTTDLINNNDKTYSREDYDLLCKVIKRFKKLIITPHIITEVSNLSITKQRVIKGDKHFDYVGSVIGCFMKAQENHQEINCLWKLGIRRRDIGTFGFTDLTMFALAKTKNKKIPIITDDFPLYMHLMANHIPTIKLGNLKNQKLQAFFQNKKRDIST